jgi:hypothetical protein
MSDLCHLVDPLNPDGAVDCMLSPDWEPVIHEVGGVFAPLGFNFQTKSTDGVKGVGGILKMVSISDAQDAAIMTLLFTPTQINLTMPNGNVYGIAWDPRQDYKATSQFSLMGWQPVTLWTVPYIQVA